MRRHSSQEVAMVVPGVLIWRSIRIPDISSSPGKRETKSWPPNRKGKIVPKDVLAVVLHEVDL